MNPYGYFSSISWAIFSSVLSSFSAWFFSRYVSVCLLILYTVGNGSAYLPCCLFLLLTYKGRPLHLWCGVGDFPLTLYPLYLRPICPHTWATGSAWIVPHLHPPSCTWGRKTARLSLWSVHNLCWRPSICSVLDFVNDSNQGWSSSSWGGVGVSLGIWIVSLLQSGALQLIFL